MVVPVRSANESIPLLSVTAVSCRYSKVSCQSADIFIQQILQNHIPSCSITEQTSTWSQHGHYHIKYLSKKTNLKHAKQILPANNKAE